MNMIKQKSSSTLDVKNKYMWRQHLPCFRNDSLLPKVTSMWDWKLPGLRETGFLPPVLFQLSKHSVQLPCPASFSFCSTSQRMPPPAPSPMHTLSHIPNDPATQYKHTQSTPGRQQGEAIVFLCTFYICVTLRLYRRVKDICTSHDAQYFLFSGHSNIWGVQKIGFLQTALNSMRFPFWDKKGKKLNTFILKQQLQHKLSAQSQLPSHCLRVRLKTERWHLCLKEIRPFSKDLEGLAGPYPVV